MSQPDNIGSVLTLTNESIIVLWQRPSNTCSLLFPPSICYKQKYKKIRWEGKNTLFHQTNLVTSSLTTVAACKNKTLLKLQALRNPTIEQSTKLKIVPDSCNFPKSFAIARQETYEKVDWDFSLAGKNVKKKLFTSWTSQRETSLWERQREREREFCSRSDSRKFESHFQFAWCAPDDRPPADLDFVCPMCRSGFSRVTSPK